MMFVSRAGASRMIVTAVLIGLVLLCLRAPGASAQHQVFVTTTDYVTGSSSAVQLDGSYTTRVNVAFVHSDAVSRYYDGYFYVINRIGADNIQVLDPANNFSTVRQFSTGNGSNPLDVAFAGPTKMYVSRGESNVMWIMNPQTGAQTGSIDLSSLADADGLCEMGYILLAGDYLFVTVQRLDRNNFWVPVGDSYLAVIDVVTDTAVDTDPVTPGVQPITLAYANPFSEIQLDPWAGRLYVSVAGYYGLQDGGVEAVDPAALVSLGAVITETAAGGDITDVEITGPETGYAIVQNASFNTDLIFFDPATGAKISTLYAPGAYVLQDVEQAPTGEVFLSDRTAVAPGLRVYDAATGTELTSSPIDVGLPPFDICFDTPVQTAARPAPPFAHLGGARPNPFNPSTHIPYSLDRTARVTIEVFDARGARVRTLVDETKPAGEYDIEWDGRDARSVPAPSGVYFARMVAGDYRGVSKMILLK